MNGVETPHTLILVVLIGRPASICRLSSSETQHLKLKKQKIASARGGGKGGNGISRSHTHTTQPVSQSPPHTIITILQQATPT